MLFEMHRFGTQDNGFKMLTHFNSWAKKPKSIFHDTNMQLSGDMREYDETFMEKNQSVSFTPRGQKYDVRVDYALDYYDSYTGSKFTFAVFDVAYSHFGQSDDKYLSDNSVFLIPIYQEEPLTAAHALYLDPESIVQIESLNYNDHFNRVSFYGDKYDTKRKDSEFYNPPEIKKVVEASPSESGNLLKNGDFELWGDDIASYASRLTDPLQWEHFGVYNVRMTQGQKFKYNAPPNDKTNTVADLVDGSILRQTVDVTDYTHDDATFTLSLRHAHHMSGILDNGETLIRVHLSSTCFTPMPKGKKKAFSPNVLKMTKRGQFGGSILSISQCQKAQSPSR